MNYIRALVTTTALFTLASVTQASPQTATKPYRFIRQIDIGGEGGWDYLTIDSASRRLFVTHGTKVEVIDLDSNAVVGTVEGLPGVHGVALAPQMKLGFASNGAEAKAAVFDLDTLKVSSKVATGENPDAILFEPLQGEVYTFNGRGHSATVFNAKSGTAVATIPLPGKPEFAVLDSAAGLIYDNIEDKNAVVVIDIHTHAVAKTWPVAPCESASGMAFDSEHSRLFLGCENHLMAMLDSKTGKFIAGVPIGEGVDANAFDPVTQLAFSSNGEGNVTIAHEDSPTHLKVIQTLTTVKGARTMALDSQTHRIYLAVADREQPTATSKGRPPVIPGTFRILVYGME